MDEDLLLSYWADAVSLKIPGSLIIGKGGPPRPVCSTSCRRFSWTASRREEHDLWGERELSSFLAAVTALYEPEQARTAEMALLDE